MIRPSSSAPPDRHALVTAQDVVVSGVDPVSPLSVGNGRLATTVDVTGLQTFPAAYPLAEAGGGPAGTMLGTLAEWGWHAFPDQGFVLSDTHRSLDTAHGRVPFVDATAGANGRSGSGLTPAEAWLRANPHRIDLLRSGFTVDGEEPRLGQLGRTTQRLRLWEGLIVSEFDLAGRRLQVLTCVHPDLDAVAVRVSGDLHGIGVRLTFGYGSGSWNLSRDDAPESAHSSVLDGPVVRRTLDATTYSVRVGGSGTLSRSGRHAFDLTSTGDRLDLVTWLTPGSGPTEEPPSVEECLRAAGRHWEEFWSSGAAVDVAESRDPRAPELQRRIVLSQFLTALHSAGTQPPAETGLALNSWRGRSHLEMHPWHAAHFPLWGRAHLLERSLDWYRGILPVARATARRQNLPGARWPKQVTPDGTETPSDIGPFLLWQQPHPVQLAELARRSAGPDHEAQVLARWSPVVEATAEFMAALPVQRGGSFHLDPPLVPAQESYAGQRDLNRDPTFELASWAWGLRTAAAWVRATGREPDPRWEHVADRMARPPVRDGRYPAMDAEPFLVRQDHPSMLCALGVVPATGVVDPGIVRATLHDVLGDWDWDSAWGWDFPAMAMTATRLGEPLTAVDALLLDVPKNRYLANGHNHQTAQLPVYLPGNGGLLAAVALMVAGFDGDDDAATPGFPDDGSWTVRHEGFHRSP